MRTIDLLKDIMDVDIPDIPVNRSISICGLNFESMNSDSVNPDYGLTGETKIIRCIICNGRYYSIGIGTNKLRGWIKFAHPGSFIVLDLHDFVEQDESYLILKYGRLLLDEI